MRHSPTRERAVAVVAITSGLVDVLTAGPDATRRLGMINEDVLPDRGGPRTNTDCSGGANIQSLSRWPRYMP